MTYVTFTDHNRIDGCLQIAEFSDTFISEEVTAQFPDDNVNIHLLLWNLTETQHAEIQRSIRGMDFPPLLVSRQLFRSEGVVPAAERKGN